MFVLKLKDRNGAELNLGDIVAISNDRKFKFYARVTWLEKEKRIAPMHTFAFHSLLKVDSVPEDAVKLEEPRFDVWFVGSRENPDEAWEEHKRYLIDWRQCEHIVENLCFDLEPLEPYRAHLPTSITQFKELLAGPEGTVQIPFPAYIAKPKDFDDALRVAKTIRHVTKKTVYAGKNGRTYLSGLYQGDLSLWDFGENKVFAPIGKIDDALTDWNSNDCVQIPD